MSVRLDSRILTWDCCPTPLCAVATQHIPNKVMADHGLTGVFNLVVGPGSSVGERMLNDPRIPLVSFTGSTQVGKRVAAQVAQRFGRTILELGGNNAIVVAEDANLDMATRAILFGAVGTAGQRCTSTPRIIAHKQVVGELASRLVKAYAQVRIGDPLDPHTLMGPLVTPDALDDMKRALDQAKAEGGEILHGGRMRPDLGPQFVEPTIVRMPAQTAIVEAQTFAPILYILEYEHFSDALEMHNAVPQGLSSAIFTESVRRAEEYVSARGSDCGIANVNIGTSGAEIGGAFGVPSVARGAPDTLRGFRPLRCVCRAFVIGLLAWFATCPAAALERRIPRIPNPESRAPSPEGYNPPTRRTMVQPP